MRKWWLLFLLNSCVFANAMAQVVSTIAGSAGSASWVDGTGIASRFNTPQGITADQNGTVFIADRLNNRIRKITSSGVVTTFAGSGNIGSVDAQGTAASFYEPCGIACDTLGNVYVADTKNYKIRKIDAAGNVTTVAGVGIFGTTNGPVNVATFGFPTGIAVSRDGSIIYVADYNTHVIRKIFNGNVTTFSGIVYVAGANDGLASVATFNHPRGIQLDWNNNLIVADEWNNIIRRVSPAGNVTTIAGTGTIGSIDGASAAALFNYPGDVAVDSLNNIYVTDGFNNTIRKITAATNQVTTYAGTAGITGAVDGAGAAASFNGPAGVMYNRNNKCLYVADTYNHTIRKITAVSAIQITLAVTGSSTLCAADSLHLTAVPSGLSNYTISEGAVVLGSSATGSVSIPPLSSGIHTLTCTALDGTGATANSNTVTVTVLSPFVPVITAGGSTSFCPGDSVKLTAQPGTLYHWSQGAATSSIYVSTAGTYSVTVTNSNGCKGISTPIVIVVHPAPVATIAAAAAHVCPGATTTLTASAGVAWQWSQGAVSQSIIAGSGAYTVTVTDLNGCSAISSVTTITDFSVTPPVISPSGVVTILQGDSLTLTASGGVSYSWNSGTSGAALVVSNSGYYSVVSTNSDGCTAASATVQVIQITSQNILTAAGSTSFCEGGNVVLSSVFATNNQWYFNGLPVAGAVNQQYTALDSGYYKVACYINNQWIFSDSLLVKVFSAPLQPTVSDTAICSNNAVLLQFTPVAGINYNWYDQPVAGTVLSAQNFYQTPVLSANATYYIEAINAAGCTSVARTYLNVLIKPTPTVSFTHSTQLQSGQYVVTFSNGSINADHYVWIFGDTSIAGNSSVLSDPVYHYPSVGEYTVTLIASNDLGCAQTLSEKIVVSGNNAMFVPTTFTPNGDGKNDVFRVRGDQITLEEMQIYDQWGKVIYRTDQSKPNWDGTVNGETVANGTYVYRIRIINKDHISQELTGPITVIK